jgi:hypothetical protein
VLKKLLFFSIIIACLFFSPYTFGEFSFIYNEKSISAHGNLVLTGIVVLWLFSDILVGVANFYKQHFRQEIDSMINLVLSNKSSFEKNTKKMGKYVRLNEAIVCAISEKLCVLPEKYFDIKRPGYRKSSRLLFAHKNLLNIKKYMQDGNRAGSISTILNVIKYCPEHVSVIQKEILLFSNSVRFDPKKYKYNLSNKFIKQYLANTATQEYSTTKRLDSLKKYNKDYPGNINVVDILSSKENDDKKLADLVGNCFKIHPDRRLAYILLRSKRQDTLMNVAESMAGQTKNTEECWFVAIVATELGYVSRACDSLKTMILSARNEIVNLTKFVFLNYSKFSNNIEFLQLVNEELLNESGNCKTMRES